MKRVPLALSTKCQSGAKRGKGHVSPLYFSLLDRGGYRVTGVLAVFYSLPSCLAKYLCSQNKVLETRHKMACKSLCGTNTACDLHTWQRICQITINNTYSYNVFRGGKKTQCSLCKPLKFHTIRHLSYNYEFHFSKWLLASVSALEFASDLLSNPKSLQCVIEGENCFTKGLYNPKDESNPADKYISNAVILKQVSPTTLLRDLAYLAHRTLNAYVIALGTQKKRNE